MSEASGQSLEQLQMLAQRLRTNPSFMAWVLGSYQKQERISTLQLEERLELSPHMLARLALCKRPDTNSPDFRKQVSQIAQYVSMDPARLANLIRQVESLDGLAKLPGAAANEKQAPSLNAGLLAAARDREDQAEESEGSADSQDTGREDAAG